MEVELELKMNKKERAFDWVANENRKEGMKFWMIQLIRKETDKRKRAVKRKWVGQKTRNIWIKKRKNDIWRILSEMQNESKYNQFSLIAEECHYFKNQEIRIYSDLFFVLFYLWIDRCCVGLHVLSQDGVSMINTGSFNESEIKLKTKIKILFCKL